METIETLNKRLADIYGKFETGDPNWRVVWTPDQIEKRYGTYTKTTEHGIYLGEETGWREVKKYNYLQPQWMLERLVPVPTGCDIDGKVSYEPLWGFRHDHFGNPLPAKWEVIEIVISTLHQQLARDNSVAHYDTPFLEQQSEEAVRARVEVMEDMLFEKSRIGDRLAIGEGVSMSGARLEVPETK